MCPRSSNKNPFAWNAILGEYDRGAVDGHEKLVKVDTLIVHSSFSSVEGGNDIAMLRIATSNVSTYSRYVRPVCLPDKTESFQHLTCTITGWGAAHSGGYGTRYLYKANVPVLTNEVCSYLLNRPITEGELCAGERMGGVDTCQGDSGGPMVVHKDGVWKLAGVTSWGQGCAASFSPGVYTNVAHYKDWVNTVMQYYTSTRRRRGLGATRGLHYV
ncbi:coagulation factor XI-like [Babylonia areolata]|uniref:coagulation factor XI-like n=1 Tax=Babylonia areolata TaxID=304850 RepID=UPI003FD5F4CB